MIGLAFLGLAVALSPAGPQPLSVWDTYRMRAELGSVRAQAVIGFRDGDLHWLRLAARRGDTECQLKTAEILRSRHENQEALYWYRRASKRSIQAVYALGSM